MVNSLETDVLVMSSLDRHISDDIIEHSDDIIDDRRISGYIIGKMYIVLVMTSL